MIVRIRFGSGRVLTHRKGRNGKAALLFASMLTLVAISLGILGLWRLCQDLGFAGDFVFSTGLLSHWQVWLASAAALQYASWRLTQYSEVGAARIDDNDSELSGDAPASTRAEKISARI